MQTKTKIIRIDPRSLGLLTVDRAAELRGVWPKTVLRWIREGLFPVVVVGDSRPVYLIRREDLDRFSQPKRGPVAK